MTPSSRRRLAVGTAGALVVLVLAAGCSDDDSDSAGDDPTSTTMATGDLEIPAPDGWLSVPLPTLGFGVAVPPGWEATRLDEEAMSSIGQADPVVPDFVAAAHNAYTSGSVFYAAGVDPESRITDLKIGADLESGVEDTAGLQSYAGELAAALVDPTVTVVEDAEHPTVDIRFRGTAGGDAGSLAVEGTQRLVLSPAGIVYSLIMTSEDPATHDPLATQLFQTFTFGKGA